MIKNLDTGLRALCGALATVRQRALAATQAHHRLGALALGALTAIALGQARADDTDLFMTGGQSGTAPNMLLMIDNTANWDSQLGGGLTKNQLEHEALYETFVDDPSLAGTGTADDPVRLRLGFMHFSDANNPRGGKVIRHVGDLTPDAQGQIACLLYANDGCDIEEGNEGLEKSNNAPYAMMFNEAYRYFAGLTPHSGTRDGNHDPAAVGADGYNSPAEGNCGKNYLVLIGNGEPDSGEDKDAENALDGLGGRLNSDPIDLDPGNFASNWSDEYARFLNDTDVVPEAIREGKQPLTTYVIDVYNPDSNQANTKKFKAARTWLKSIAAQGEGRYFAAHSKADIKAALTTIVNELQAVNDVFASTTLPVSVNVRGTNLNQVYMGVFRPDDQNRPRWMGNLKLYRLVYDPTTDSVFLGDQNGQPVESALGFIVFDAVSFWTHDSTFWSWSPRGTPASGSDSPDGEVVEKGGAAQRLRDENMTDVSQRELYTCTSGCGAGDALTGFPFSTANSDITADKLGVSSTAERDALIDWVRGVNNKTDDAENASAAAIRPSVHGDVLHSRPAVVNYGNGDVVAYYGANDGIIHAVQGGIESSNGNELWGFIAPEFFGDLKQLYDNPTLDHDAGERRPIFADGHIGVWEHDANGNGVLSPLETGDRVYIYVGMRRGGRFVYALDVTDKNNPKLLWTRSAQDSGFAELGQSWSQPTPAPVRAHVDAEGNPIPVVFFGAGYDPGSDDTHAPHATAARSMGRGIFAVDGRNGDLIWRAGPDASASVQVSGMTHSFPADLTIIDRNEDGLADRIYAADTGGNVWRVDIDAASSSDWAVHQLAALADPSTTAGKRRFLFAPDVVYGEDTGGAFDAVLLGSGDRENPFSTAVANRFYMLKDYETGLSVSDPSGYTTLTEADLYDATDNLVQDGSTTQQSQAKTDIDNARGWYIRLTNAGEKVVGSAVTLNNATFFVTNEPPDQNATCAETLGTARSYVVDFKDASSIIENDGSQGLSRHDRYSELPGGGFPPSPVPAIVEFEYTDENGDTRTVTAQTVLIGPAAKAPPGITLGQRRRVFWHELNGD